jgi:hypothetical protein
MWRAQNVTRYSFERYVAISRLMCVALCGRWMSLAASQQQQQLVQTWSFRRADFRGLLRQQDGPQLLA